MDRKPDKVALTPAEFAALFGKSTTWGYRQLYAGKVKAITEYGRTLIPASEVERILNEAGRYNGAGAKLSQIVEPELPRTKAAKNSWQKALEKRRGKSKSSASRKKKGSAARNQVLGKLNKRRKK